MVAALSPDLELVGATTVNGNTTVDYTTENTLRVFDWIGMPEIPGIAGLDRPLVRSQVERGMATRIHGICSTFRPPRTAPRPAGPCRRLADRDVPLRTATSSCARSGR